jgi:prophage antirepressor-like protein
MENGNQVLNFEVTPGFKEKQLKMALPMEGLDFARDNEGQIRTMTFLNTEIPIFRDSIGRIWFMAAQICKMLNYARANNAIKDHCTLQQALPNRTVIDMFDIAQNKQRNMKHPNGVSLLDAQTMSGENHGMLMDNSEDDQNKQSSNSHSTSENYLNAQSNKVLNLARRSIGTTVNIFIQDRDLHKLILCSSMPKAAQYADFVLSEVLPAITKYGFYIAGQESLDTTQMEALKSEVQTLTQSMNNLQLENQNLKQRMLIQEEITTQTVSKLEAHESYKYLPTKLVQAKFGWLLRENKGSQKSFVVAEVFNYLRMIGLTTAKVGSAGKMLTDEGRNIFKNYVLEVNPHILSSTLHYAIEVFDIVPELEDYMKKILMSDVEGVIRHFNNIEKVKAKYELKSSQLASKK